MVVRPFDDADVRRRGLEVDDVRGRPVNTTNQYKNVLGIFPGAACRWCTAATMPSMKFWLIDAVAEDGSGPGRQPKPPQGRPAPAINPELAKFYQPKPGFSNYYFNKLEQDRLLGKFTEHGNFTPLLGQWDFEGQADVQGRKGTFKIGIGDEEDRTKEGKPVARAWTYHLKPRRCPRPRGRRGRG